MILDYTNSYSFMQSKLSVLLERLNLSELFFLSKKIYSLEFYDAEDDEESITFRLQYIYDKNLLYRLEEEVIEFSMCSEVISIEINPTANLTYISVCLIIKDIKSIMHLITNSYYFSDVLQDLNVIIKSKEFNIGEDYVLTRQYSDLIEYDNNLDITCNYYIHGTSTSDAFYMFLAVLFSNIIYSYAPSNHLFYDFDINMEKLFTYMKFLNKMIPNESEIKNYTTRLGNI